MATASIDRVGGTAVDYSIQEFDESTFVRLPDEALASGGVRSSYSIATGDGNKPTIISFTTKSDRNGNAGKGVRTLTIGLSSYARYVDDASVTFTEPITMALHMNVPTNIPVEEADLRVMAENLYSLSYSTLTSKEPDTVRLSKLALFGATGVI